MFGLGVSEIVIIAIVAMILLFGSKKVVEIARSLGRVGGEFQKGKRDIEAELRAGEVDKSTTENGTTVTTVQTSSSDNNTNENKTS